MKDYLPATFGNAAFPAASVITPTALYPAPQLNLDVTMWGDSFTNGVGGSVPPLSLVLPTYRRRARGYGGETSTQILSHFAAEPSRFFDVSIIWAGRNNNSSPTTVKADIASMIASLHEPKQFVVLSIHNSSDEPSGSAAHTRIVALNSDLETLYPSNFLDTREYLISQGNGTTDNTDVANDVVPSSLRSDILHLNDAGYLKVAQQIEAFFTSKGW